MKRALLIICFALSACFTQAQSQGEPSLNRYNNNLYLSLLGDGSLFALNYERFFEIKSNLFLAGKIGIGHNEEFRICIGPCSPSEKFLTIPHQVTANFGSRKNFFEVGLGGTVITGETKENYFLYPIISFRRESLKPKRFNLRIFASVPFTGLDTRDILFWPVGISFGRNF